MDREIASPPRPRMQVLTVCDTARHVRTHTVTGMVNLAELRPVRHSICRSPQFDPDMDALWDIRRADLSSLMPVHVRELMHIVVDSWGRSGRCRCALFVSIALGFGIA